MNLRTVLIAVTAAAALIGAAVVSVPSTPDRASDIVFQSRPAR